MKYIIVIFSFVLISSCQNNKKTSNVSDKSISETVDSIETPDMKAQTSHIATINADDDDRNFRQIGLDEKIGNRTLKDYLSDEKIPKVFKDIFQQKRRISDDEETFALLDSLSSTDKKRHPFYFVLVTRVTWWSDGAISEVLGMRVRKYVESNTKQFLTYFSTEPVLTQFDFKNWAKYTLYEIMIDSSDNIDIKKLIEKTRNIMRKNCSDCSSEKLKLIDKFAEDMYAEYEKN